MEPLSPAEIAAVRAYQRRQRRRRTALWGGASAVLLLVVGLAASVGRGAVLWCAAGILSTCLVLVLCASRTATEVVAEDHPGCMHTRPPRPRRWRDRVLGFLVAGAILVVMALLRLR